MLVALDALFANEIVRRLRARAGAGREIFVAASHTHFAPSLSPEFPRLGELSEPYCAAAFERVVATIERAEARARAARRAATVSPLALGEWIAVRRRRPGVMLRRSRPRVSGSLAARFARALAGDGPPPIWATSAGECLGYACTDEEHVAGGYEGEGWAAAFGCRSRVLSGADGAFGAPSGTLARAAVPDGSGERGEEA